MSDAFKEREKGFEAKYKIDQDKAFKVGTRRDKLFGLWLAGKLGLSGAAADQDANDVVASKFEKPGDDDMIAKVKKDIAAKGVAIDDKELLSKLNSLADDAARQVISEG
ncbi:MAG: DUF1476 domain-containing protein [Rhodospirillaceae bacterium]|nr:DUF1476 domain-containing protein [Rhodospirillaceae bacterium]